MKSESFKEAIHDERKLWEASDQYMRGDIDAKKLEEAEERYERYIKKATLAPTKQASIHNYLQHLKLSIVAIIIALAVLLSISIILLFKNSLLLLFLIPLTIYLVRYMINNKFLQAKSPEEKKELIS